MDRFLPMKETARKLYTADDPSHDFAHIERVIKNCQRLGSAVGANPNLLLPAALLHDVVNIPKNHPDRSSASRLAAEKAEQILLHAGYSKDEISAITAIIAQHSYSAKQRPSTLESAVLQDADKLDALGAVGIMRTVTCGALMKASYYHSGDPWAKSRPHDDKIFTIDHFFTKLFTLPDLMNTELAKVEAQARVEFMKNFLKQLEYEAYLTP